LPYKYGKFPCIYGDMPKDGGESGKNSTGHGDLEIRTWKLFAYINENATQYRRMKQHLPVGN
jgi:hypothetical protein